MSVYGLNKELATTILPILVTQEKFNSAKLQHSIFVNGIHIAITKQLRIWQAKLLIPLKEVQLQQPQSKPLLVLIH